MWSTISNRSLDGCQNNLLEAQIKTTSGPSPEVQWLRLRASTAGGAGSIPGRGTKILKAAQQGQELKKYINNWKTKQYKTTSPLSLDKILTDLRINTKTKLYTVSVRMLGWSGSSRPHPHSHSLQPPSPSSHPLHSPCSPIAGPFVLAFPHCLETLHTESSQATVLHGILHGIWTWLVSL